jgi:hypothetical protein
VVPGLPLALVSHAACPGLAFWKESFKSVSISRGTIIRLHVSVHVGAPVPAHERIIDAVSREASPSVSMVKDLVSESVHTTLSGVVPQRSHGHD